MSKYQRPRTSATRSTETEPFVLHEYLIGVDEAGRGALAGPVMAASVALPLLNTIKGLRDSKLLTALGREKAFERIATSEGVAWAVGEASVSEIAEMNILQASMLAMHRALKGLEQKVGCKPEHIMVDGNYFHNEEYTSFRTIVRGDKLVPAISAASIVAKVMRDRFMRDVAHLQFPEYGFATHKGYATKAHRTAIVEHGACALHRSLFLRNVWAKHNERTKQGHLL
jgi:ribonuclease HII